MFPRHTVPMALVAIVLFILLCTGTYLLLKDPGSEPGVVPGKGSPATPSAASNFEECVAAGNAVMESYPRQCRSIEGRLFVEDIDEPIAESFGSIQGTALLGPSCPVMQDPPDPNCADKPYQTTLALTTPDGSRVMRQFTSRSDGTFSIDVPAGDYAIRSVAAANILPYCSSSGIIHVPVNDTVVANVSCDTGIR